MTCIKSKKLPFLSDFHCYSLKSVNDHLQAARARAGAPPLARPLGKLENIIPAKISRSRLQDHTVRPRAPFIKDRQKQEPPLDVPAAPPAALTSSGKAVVAGATHSSARAGGFAEVGDGADTMPETQAVLDHRPLGRSIEAACQTVLRMRPKTEGRLRISGSEPRQEMTLHVARKSGALWFKNHDARDFSLDGQAVLHAQLPDGRWGKTQLGSKLRISLKRDQVQDALPRLIPLLYRYGGGDDVLVNWKMMDPKASSARKSQFQAQAVTRVVGLAEAADVSVPLTSLQNAYQRGSDDDRLFEGGQFTLYLRPNLASNGFDPQRTARIDEMCKNIEAVLTDIPPGPTPSSDLPLGRHVSYRDDRYVSILDDEIVKKMSSHPLYAGLRAALSAQFTG